MIYCISWSALAVLKKWESDYSDDGSSVVGQQLFAVLSSAVSQTPPKQKLESVEHGDLSWKQTWRPSALVLLNPSIFVILKMVLPGSVDSYEGIRIAPPYEVQATDPVHWSSEWERKHDYVIAVEDKLVMTYWYGKSSFQGSACSRNHQSHMLGLQQFRRQGLQ